MRSLLLALLIAATPLTGSPADTPRGSHVSQGSSAATIQLAGPAGNYTLTVSATSPITVSQTATSVQLTWGDETPPVVDPTPTPPPVDPVDPPPTPTAPPRDGEFGVAKLAYDLALKTLSRSEILAVAAAYRSAATRAGEFVLPTSGQTPTHDRVSDYLAATWNTPTTGTPNSIPFVNAMRAPYQAARAKNAFADEDGMWSAPRIGAFYDEIVSGLTAAAGAKP